MYNICYLDKKSLEYAEAFGDRYDPTDDISQANVLVTCGEKISEDMLSSKLVFAVADLSLGEACVSYSDLLEKGTVVFRSGSESDVYDTALRVRDYIENGNITGSSVFPDITLGGFDEDISRISILMKGIEDPILLGAMMFSGMDLKAVSGGTGNGYGYALVSSREAVTRVPHVEGVLKVRVLQDI